MFKIKCMESDDAIRDFLLKALEHITTSMKDALVTLCKECDERARDNDGGWKDRTGNLRSSIGGAVFDKGLEYFMTDFKHVLEGSIGSAKGREMAEQFARQYTDAVIMVMVAGMPYSDYVEALERTQHIFHHPVNPLVNNGIGNRPNLLFVKIATLDDRISLIREYNEFNSVSG